VGDKVPEVTAVQTTLPPQESVERALFWIPFLSFAYFYQGADQSTGARFDLMRSIVEHRTLSIDGFCGYNTADIITLGGHYYSVKAPGGSFSGILQWILFTSVLSPLTAKHEALYWALCTWLTTVFSTSLIVALAGVTMYRLIILLEGTPGRAVACALTMAFATIVFPYATEMTGEPIAAACALIAFYLIASQGPEDEASRTLAAGMLAGWAVLCDFPALLIAAPLALYALFRLGLNRQLAAFTFGALVVGVVLLAYNRSAFDNPLFLSYEAYKSAENSQFPEQAIGFVGLTYPRLNILFKILIDPQRGLLFCNPVLLLTVPAIVFMATRPRLRAEALLLGFAVIAMILFNASFGESIVSWGGGTATGPRQLAAAIPFMVVPLAFLPKRWNPIFAGLAAVSGFAMLMAAAVEPHFPYEYDNPLRDFALQGYLRGDFAYDRDAFFGGAAIVDESTAFNLGKLAGLPGVLQLWPLAILWLGSGWWLPKKVNGASRRRWPRAAAAVALGLVFALPLIGIAVARVKPQPRNGLLGRYYRELEPNGFLPHLVRVDPTLNFDSVGALGGLPAPSRVVWSGTLTVPRTGDYRFGVEADDSGWLTIDGAQVIRDPGHVTQGSGIGEIFLTAGPHRIEAGERNLAGGSAMRLSWVPPDGQPAIVPSDVLTPR
jgi:PA14 domain-containing protein